MGYYYDRTLFKKTLQVFYYHLFIFGIEGIGGFIKEEVGRVFINCSGNQYTLALALADTVALQANLGLELLG